MNCDFKTMLKIAVALGLALVFAYVALPGVQAFVLASAPILVALICPIAMLFMMRGMNKHTKDKSAEPGVIKKASEHQDANPDKA